MRRGRHSLITNFKWIVDKNWGSDLFNIKYIYLSYLIEVMEVLVQRFKAGFSILPGGGGE